jgi:hypothetical protein
LVTWKARVADYVTGCYEILKRYGDDGSTLPRKIQAFQLLLKDYDEEKIKKAFFKYLRDKSEFPAPSDIIDIIEGRKKLKMDHEFYRSLKRQSFRTMEENDYVKAYEKQLKASV